MIVFSAIACEAKSINLPLTLESAIDKALQHNQSILSKQNSLSQSAWSIDEAQTEFDFSIRPDATASFDNAGNDRNRLGLVSQKKYQSGAHMSVRIGSQSFGDKKSNVFSVELNQPLFRNRGKLINTLPLYRAEQSHIRALREFQSARYQLTMNVIQSYIRLLKFQREIEADKKSVERTAFSLRSLQARESVGLATSIERLRAEVQHGEALQNVKVTQNNIEKNVLALLDLMGDKSTDTLVTTDTNIPIPKISNDVDTLYDLALANRLDIATAQQKKNEAHHNVLITEREKLPEIDLRARIELADDDVFIDDPLGQLDSQRFVIELSSNTGFSRKRNNIRFQQALNAERTTDEELAILRRSIRSEIVDTVKEKRLIEQRIVLAKANLEHATERLVLAERMFNLGREPQITVFDAEASFNQSEQVLIQAKSDLLLLKYKIKFVTGTLLEVPEQFKPRSNDGWLVAQ